MSVVTETLTGSTLTLGRGGLKLPVTVTLKSSDAGRLIEISTDGGVEYFAPVVDTTSATMLVVVLAAHFSNIRATGAIADTLTLVD